MQDPIQRFNDWWHLATTDSPLRQKSAVCVSTISSEGFPNSRFVDLKAASAEGFTFCTALDSMKGRQIRENPRVALIAWWDHVGFQVRVVGTAKPLPEAEAEKYWRGRSREAQLTTVSFRQSEPLEPGTELGSVLEQARRQSGDVAIDKPADWGGFVVSPRSVEFLTFRRDRLHERELYERRGETWLMTRLQP